MSYSRLIPNSTGLRNKIQQNNRTEKWVSERTKKKKTTRPQNTGAVQRGSDAIERAFSVGLDVVSATCLVTRWRRRQGRQGRRLARERTADGHGGLDDGAEDGSRGVRMETRSETIRDGTRTPATRPEPRAKGTKPQRQWHWTAVRRAIILTTI